MTEQKHMGSMQPLFVLPLLVVAVFVLLGVGLIALLDPIALAQMNSPPPSSVHDSLFNVLLIVLATSLIFAIIIFITSRKVPKPEAKAP